MTFKELIALIAETSGLEVSGATPDTPLGEALDSLSLVALLIDAEEHGVPVPDELVESWVTLGEVHAQLDRWYDAGSMPADDRPARRDRLSVLEVERAHVVTVPVLPEHVPALHDLASRGRNAYAWWHEADPYHWPSSRNDSGRMSHSRRSWLTERRASCLDLYASPTTTSGTGTLN